MVNLAFLSIVALLLSWAFSTIMGYGLIKIVGDKPYVKPMQRLFAEKNIKDYESINDRNLFAAKREELAEEEEDPGREPGRWQDATLSSLPLKLASTMVFVDPFASRATIVDLNTNSGKVFSIGDCDPYIKKNSPSIETVLPPSAWEPGRPCNDIFGSATLRRIEEAKVYIFNERDRKWEYLLLDGQQRPMFRPAFLEPKVEKEGIRKIGEFSYEIDQSELDKSLSNMARLMTEAKALPKTDASGNVIGFEIVYMKSGSLFEKIGIKKGDVLTRVNGYDLASLEKALELFSKLRSSDRFNIDIKRVDRPVTLDYSVVRKP